ncbi:MASE1 domain-containing protein [Stenotrophomonas sp. AB1(2024)]|uniref:MASE1 domain-containing protein n=1 Tax=Stenotrophomonas sp. AB1(2024) TaxID=3132215 RepID=UPI003098B753
MDWWRNGLQLEFRVWPAGFAIAALYALGCWAARQVSLDQFYLPAGLRIAALLLIPPRQWIYLALGEYAYFASMRVPMIDKYGLAWVVLGSVLIMPTVAGIVHLHRKLLRKTGDAWVMSIALTSAIAVTMLNLSTSHLLWPDPPHNAFITDAARSMLGQFVGTLAVVPLALLWLRRKAKWLPDRRPAAASLAALILMVTMALVAMPSVSDDPSIRVAIHQLMVLPAIALTCMLGWRGAAISSAVLHLSIGLTTDGPLPWSFDASSFGAQQSLAVSGTALLVLGYTISHYRRRTWLAERNVRDTARCIKATHLVGESHLRDRVHALREVGEGIDRSMSEICRWIESRGHAPFANALLRMFVEHSRNLRDKTSMVYPVALDHVGLYLALQIGGIAGAWKETQRVAAPTFGGDPCLLSIGLQLAAYRAMEESVSLLLAGEPGQLRVCARAWRLGSRRGIMLRIAMLDRQQKISDATANLATIRLAGRVVAYGGTVQCRGNRILISLVEGGSAGTGSSGATQ